METFSFAVQFLLSYVNSPGLVGLMGTLDAARINDAEAGFLISFLLFPDHASDSVVLLLGDSETFSISGNSSIRSATG